MTPFTRRLTFPLILATSALALALGTAHAQDAAAPAAPTAAIAYEPEVGQAGKDVVWVPTAQALVDQMLLMADITPDDYLVDLGSGDGRTVITAAQRGTRAHGIEYNPDLVNLSRKAAQAAGVTKLATFTEGDIFESDFSDATVVTMFLLPSLNLRLRPILLDMKPGTRIVSNSFDMDDWEPDVTIERVDDCDTYCRAYKWIIPAKVDGTWQLVEGTTLSLEQHFQKLAGTLNIDGTAHPISDAAMQGADIAFTANGQRYTGTVTTDTQITGTNADDTAWVATRQP